MHSTVSIISRFKLDFPSLSFKNGNSFAWSPSEKTVYYDEYGKDATCLVLHETAHGLLGHTNYSKDIELIGMERQAWEKAAEIAKKYDVTIDEETVQSNLDSYRDWLHARSTCPNCTATGVQETKNTYTCLACGHKWRVNEARVCGLKRYKI
ncbi:MAG TPA: hypothetical protein PLZ58_03055 [Candidatus Saccharibacteria bacterium]|nr:hypothetical protein [Candidatus Saccharibacteria bacterium]HRQ06950.1 hypothetical protein [Candidatus Saccharibacteria bacterium]